MPEPKAQLIDPQGPIDVPGLSVTGVTTATGGFVGKIQGTATGLASTTTNLSVGIVTATKFVGNTPGNVSGLADGTNINVGIITSTSFTGDLVGNAAGLSTTTANIKAGILSATSFAGNFTGVASGITGTPNIVVGIMTGTLKGDGSGLTGIAATNWITNNVTTTSATAYAINVTASGSSNYTLSGNDRNGSVSGSDPSVAVNVGDTLNFAVDASGHPFYIRVSDGGASVSTPAATNQGTQSGTVSWTPNTAGTYYYQCGNHAGMIGTITVSDSTTLIDLSKGNVVKFTQSVSTTVSFANTGTSNIVTFIRTKDDTSTERTITWPSSVKWDGGAAPLLNATKFDNDVEQFQLLTRDEGVTWYGWNTIDKSGGYGMWFWGRNELGEAFGLAIPADRSSPTQLGEELEWTKMYGAGGTNIAASHCGAAKQPGTLWMWGMNRDGELAQNTKASPANAGFSSPVQVPGTNWNTVSFAYRQTLATKTDNTLWTWGADRNGNKGTNTNGVDYSSPIQIPGTWNTGYKSISQGYNATAAIKVNNQLWVWGQGQLCGDSNTASRSSPILVSGQWSQISLSASSAMGLKTDGTLWSWGSEAYGATGHSNRTDVSSPIQIPGTTWSYCLMAPFGAAAIKTDGTLWSWGDNRYGQLGLNNRTNYSSPKQIPGTNWNMIVATTASGGGLAESRLATKTDGTLWGWGMNNMGQLTSGPGMAVPNRDQRSSPVQLPGTNWISTEISARRYGVTTLRPSS